MLIQEIRESAGLSRRELARQSGVPESTLRHIESGRTKTPEVATIDKILDSLAKYVELAYIAGLVDRASRISINKVKPQTTGFSSKIKSPPKANKYLAVFIIHSVHREIPELIKRVLGVGAVTTVKSNNTVRDYAFQYYAHCEAAEIALEQLLPYLKIKRNKVEVLLAFREKLKENKKARGSVAINSSRGSDYVWDQDKHNEEYDFFYNRIREA